MLSTEIDYYQEIWNIFFFSNLEKKQKKLKAIQNIVFSKALLKTLFIQANPDDGLWKIRNCSKQFW